MGVAVSASVAASSLSSRNSRDVKHGDRLACEHPRPRQLPPGPVLLADLESGDERLPRSALLLRDWRVQSRVQRVRRLAAAEPDGAEGKPLLGLDRVPMNLADLLEFR